MWGLRKFELEWKTTVGANSFAKAVAQTKVMY
ncbi:Uncharacterised protein [Paucimonas lemoignei]|nr:Uncharacterised protein [Paucimonas lemoignei]